VLGRLSDAGPSASGNHRARRHPKTFTMSVIQALGFGTRKLPFDQSSSDSKVGGTPTFELVCLSPQVEASDRLPLQPIVE